MGDFVKFSVDLGNWSYSILILVIEVMTLSLCYEAGAGLVSCGWLICARLVMVLGMSRSTLLGPIGGGNRWVVAILSNETAFLKFVVVHIWYQNLFASNR